MDINKLNNVNHSKPNKMNEASQSSETGGTTKSSSTDSPADKVSLDDYQFRNNDKLFAKLELEKLNDKSADKLNEIKAQISEFKQASEVSSEDAEQTEMGQKLNDPAVWEDIAHKILQ